jgi:transcriptional regulator with XRE-family HTH domain
VRSTDRFAATLSRAVADLRAAVGWTQRELAVRAGTSQAAVWRTEAGLITPAQIGPALQILEALGAEFDLSMRAPLLTDRGRQRDAAHAVCSAYVRRRLERHGWLVAQEVEIGSGRWRGWIDVLAHQPAAGALLSGEIKTDLRDAGEAQRQVESHERGAWAAARGLGWRSREVRSALLVLQTESNDLRVRENRELLRQSFPVRARELLAWVAGPGTSPVSRGRALAMIDPRSKRRDWLIPTRTDGRRSPAPYLDYATFMRRSRSRR